MTTAGLDVGTKATKVVLLGGGNVLSRGLALTAFDRKASAQHAFDEALRTAGVSRYLRQVRSGKERVRSEVRSRTMDMRTLETFTSSLSTLANAVVVAIMCVPALKPF